MAIVPCGAADCSQLAAMNKMLIEDEGNDNPMDACQLTERMDGFLNGEYRAWFYATEDRIAGYALVRMDARPLYLRQFFIARDLRHMGHGRTFFGELMAELGEQAIDVEVLSWNERALAFWRAMGFEPRSVAMRRSASV